MCRALFKAIGAHRRSGAVVFVHLADLIGDRNPAVGHVQLPVAAFAGEDRIEIFGFHRLAGAGIERRHRFHRHVGPDIIPVAGYLVLFEEVSFFCDI